MWGANMSNLIGDQGEELSFLAVELGNRASLLEGNDELETCYGYVCGIFKYGTILPAWKLACLKKSINELLEKTYLPYVVAAYLRLDT